MAIQKYVDWDGLVYYDGKIKDYINDLHYSHLKYGGDYLFENLPDPALENINTIYRVVDDFTTNEDRFVQGNLIYKGGTLVQVVDNTGIYKYSIFCAFGDTVEIDTSVVYTKEETEQLVTESVKGLASTDYVDESVKNVKVDLTGYATEEFVNNAINNIDFPETDLSNYYNKEETTNLINQAIESIPEVDVSDMATKTWVGEQNFITDVSDKASKIHTHKLADITDYKEPDLTPYAKVDDVDSLLGTKANSILFNDTAIVNNAIGGFKVGDSLTGLTLVEIISRLLNVSNKVIDSVVESIKVNESPMYTVTSTGEVIEREFTVISVTESEQQTKPNESGFYEITNEQGEVIESGYQEIQGEDPDCPYMVAFTNNVDLNTNVIVYTYDEMNNQFVETWNPANNNYSDDFTDDLNQLKDIDENYYNFAVENENALPGYNLWVNLNEGSNGRILRFVIKE